MATLDVTDWDIFEHYSETERGEGSKWTLWFCVRIHRHIEQWAKDNQIEFVRSEDFAVNIFAQSKLKGTMHAVGEDANLAMFRLKFGK